MVGFLEPLRAQARTHDLLRTQLRSSFAYSELKGWCKTGSNPVTVVPPIGYKPRTRHITDSELRRVKGEGPLARQGADRQGRHARRERSGHPRHRGTNHQLRAPHAGSQDRRRRPSHGEPLEGFASVRKTARVLRGGPFRDSVKNQ